MFYSREFFKYLSQSHYSASTIREYRYLLKNLEVYCEKNDIRHAANITESHMRAYMKQVSSRGEQSGDYSHKRARLKKYFTFLENSERIFLSPLRESKRKSLVTHSYPALSENEVARILSAVVPNSPLTIKVKALIELGYSSALRPMEIANLKIGDIDFQKGLLFIQQAKCRKDRIVPVGKAALRGIQAYLETVRPRYVQGKAHQYVFVSHKTGAKLTGPGIRYAIREALRKSGLSPIKTYSLRSTAATALLNHGMSVAYISAFLGHENIRSTQTYLRVRTKDLAKRLAQVHPRLMLEEQFKNGKEVKRHEI